MTDAAWRRALICLVAVAGAAGTALLAAGEPPGRALGAAALFLAGCLPCAVIVGAVATALRRPIAPWLHAAAAIALSAAVAAGMLQVRSGGGEEHLEPDRQGIYPSR